MTSNSPDHFDLKSKRYLFKVKDTGIHHEKRPGVFGVCYAKVCNLFGSLYYNLEENFIHAVCYNFCEQIPVLSQQ